MSLKHDLEICDVRVFKPGHPINTFLQVRKIHLSEKAC